MNDLIVRAREFATHAHTRIDQRRKYTNAPYVDHLSATAKLVSSVTKDEEIIAAAWLHDTVEDTPATIEDIEQKFGREVASLVSDLTDVSKPSDGNRVARKAIDRQHLHNASARAKTVKLADLINNCVDISTHDARFARTYLMEMEALLGVLEEGDATLMKLATKTLLRASDKLGRKSLLPTPPPPPPSVAASSLSPESTQTPSSLPLPDSASDTTPLAPQVPRLFIDTFTARDIASQLLSFDARLPADEVLSTMQLEGFQVAGIRKRGRVVGYVTEADLTGSRCGDQMREILEGQRIGSDGLLVDLIHILTRQSYCFVSSFGDIGAIVSRSDMNKPVVRMWLFGLITGLEMYLTNSIRRAGVKVDWQTLLSRGRMEKSLSLYNERNRRGERCDLVDCLQLGDKLDILRKTSGFLEVFGFKTSGQARTVTKELESLRNSLAHGQDIVTKDWAQIARLARSVEELLH